MKRMFSILDSFVLLKEQRHKKSLLSTLLSFHSTTIAINPQHEAQQGFLSALYLTHVPRDLQSKSH